MDKIERLINLTACLLETRRPVSYAELKNTVYRGVSKTENAVKRMFERDKDELREMGIEVETVNTEQAGEVAYIIPRDRYYLPHLQLDPDERVALTMVSRLFLGSGTPFSVPAQLALLKLAFEEQAAPAEVPHVHWVDTPRGGELLGEILDALVRRKTLTFTYRALSGEEPAERTVEPYGLFNKNGAWYLVGFCRLRGDTRSFKLERIVGAVTANQSQPKTPDFDLPEDFDLRSATDWGWPGAGGDHLEAKVLFKARLAFAAAAGGPEPVSRRERADGGLEAAYLVNDPAEFVEWVLGFGPDAVILSPEPLREMVRLKVGSLAGERGRP